MTSPAARRDGRGTPGVHKGQGTNPSRPGIALMTP